MWPWNGFYSYHTVEESRCALCSSLWAGFLAQLYTWGMSQPFHTHSSSKVKVWCDFQHVLPLQLAPASSSRGPSFNLNFGRHSDWNRGNRGRRCRVNVSWHFGSPSETIRHLNLNYPLFALLDQVNAIAELTFAHTFICFLSILLFLPWNI